MSRLHPRKLAKSALLRLVSILPAPRHPTLPPHGLNLRWRVGWLNGQLHRPLWRVRAWFGGTRVRIGKRFCLQGRLRFQGPGLVRFGDDVIVGGFCTPFTHHPDAEIRIGDRTFLNGTRFGCARLIRVGDDCILADARIMDTDFHAVHKGRVRFGATAAEAPVQIGGNVWIAAGSMVLKGVKVGDGSVVAAGSVVTRSLPPGRIAGGNPARDFADVPEDDTALPAPSSLAHRAPHRR